MRRMAGSMPFGTARWNAVIPKIRMDIHTFKA